MQRSIPLSQYPEAIKKLQLRVLEWDRYAQSVQDELDRIEAQIELYVNCDPHLVDEADRSLRRFHLHLQGPYRHLRLELLEAESHLRESEIELQLLQNQFAVAQIQARAHVAHVELLRSA